MTPAELERALRDKINEATEKEIKDMKENKTPVLSYLFPRPDPKSLPVFHYAEDTWIDPEYLRDLSFLQDRQDNIKKALEHEETEIAALKNEIEAREFRVRVYKGVQTNLRKERRNILSKMSRGQLVEFIAEKTDVSKERLAEIAAGLVDGDDGEKAKIEDQPTVADMDE
jgi:hypothetical protein